MTRRIAWILFFLILLSVLFRLRNRFAEQDLLITFFDVGQGDSALVQFPLGKTLLIDAGGGFGDWNSGDRILLKELTRKGILTLDAVLMTHPDADHAYGFKGVLSSLNVTEFWFNAYFLKNRSSLFKELLLLNQIQGGKQVAVHGTRTFEWGGVKVELIPLLVDASTNNQALLLRLQYESCTALFTGDIETRGEENLKNRLGRVDVLKVAHHGSKTSSTESFLKRTRPQLSILSVGTQNRYGHPHRQVLERLSRVPSTLLRTDFHGFIELRIKRSGEIRCRTYLGDCGVFRCQSFEKSPMN